MKNKLFTTIVLFCAVSFFIPALPQIWCLEDNDFGDLFDDLEEDIGTENETAPADGGGFAGELKSEHTASLHMPVSGDPLVFDGPLTSTGLENLFSFSAHQGDVSLYSNWRILFSLNGEGVWHNATEIRALENYILYGPEGLSLSLGYQIIRWGVADKINPTDNVNPKDYTDLTEPTSIPVLSLYIKWYVTGAFSIEGVYVPHNDPDIFPVDAEAAVPEALFAADEVTVEQLPLDIWSGSLGLRLAAYTPLADFSLSYLFDHDPYYTPSVAYTNPMDKHLTLGREPLHRIGADAKTTIGGAGIWLETCFTLTGDPDASDAGTRNPRLEWTAGIDFNYGPGALFYANIQYNGRFIFDYDDGFFSDYPGGAPDPLQMMDPDYAVTYYYRALTQSIGGETEGLLNTLSVNFEFPFLDERITPVIRGAYLLPVFYDTEEKTRYGSLIASPRLIFKPQLSFEITLGADLFFSWYSEPGSGDIRLDTSDAVGMFGDQSNVFLELHYVWGYDL
ncbi:MAG: hypothetical protein JW881_16925 [Spirochaetales bacterium]|nr:hypothetical protein [Spirochaetales bacterium]